MALQPDGQQPRVQPAGEGDEELTIAGVLKKTLDDDVEGGAKDVGELLR